MSWADVNLNEDPVDVLAKRITDLEDTISTRFDAVHSELEALDEAVRDLAACLDERSSPSGDIEVIAARLQHAVLLALSSFEQSANGASALTVDDPLDTPATTRDIARINTRIDDLRALLLG